MPFSRSQLGAIAHGSGPAMILAGPGSGKTTVITQRVRYLTEELNVPPECILVVTFTNAAAGEMRERCSMLGDRIGGVTFGTFHAVFFSIMNHRSGSRPEVITESEKYSLMTEIFREHFRDIEADSDLINGILSELSALKNGGSPKTRHDLNGRLPDLEKIGEYYEKKKASLKRIDFDDMLVMTRDLLKSRPDELSFWQQKYSYIMVDEFQDINPVQYEIIRMLALPENNLFIVGDDDQSVYRFRGADPEIMLNFPKDYPGCRRIVLETNYRSPEEIVQASLKLIGHNKRRFQKKLRADKRKQREIEIRTFKTEEEECAWIAEQIGRASSENCPLHETAVLTRTNAGLTSVITALTEAGIPFRSRDQVRNIYRHFLMKPVFAMINWVKGNHTRENFLKFMNCPNRYIRREDLKERTVDLEKLKTAYKETPGREYMEEKIAFLQYQLELLEKLAIPFAMITFIRNFMEYDRFLSGYAEEKHLDKEAIFESFDEIQSASRAFATVDLWYAHIAGVTREIEALKDKDAGNTRDKVMLSTFHSAKGLEFRRVFIAGANEKVTPHERAETPEEIEEERRMFYVAVTRASEALYVLSTKERYGKKAAVSRFVSELS